MNIKFQNKHKRVTWKNITGVLLICLNDGHCIVGEPDALVEKCEIEIKVM